MDLAARFERSGIKEKSNDVNSYDIRVTDAGRSFLSTRFSLLFYFRSTFLFGCCSSRLGIACCWVVFVYLVLPSFPYLRSVLGHDPHDYPTHDPPTSDTSKRPFLDLRTNQLGRGGHDPKIGNVPSLPAAAAAAAAASRDAEGGALGAPLGICQSQTRTWATIFDLIGRLHRRHNGGSPKTRRRRYPTSKECDGNISVKAKQSKKKKQRNKTKPNKNVSKNERRNKKTTTTKTGAWHSNRIRSAEASRPGDDDVVVVVKRKKSNQWEIEKNDATAVDSASMPDVCRVLRMPARPTSSFT